VVRDKYQKRPRIRVARLCRFRAIGLALFLIASFPLAALEIPKAPSGRVNDYAGMLDEAARSELEAKLKTFEEATSNQLVVVTFPSLEGENLEDFSIRLADKWKIGQKGKNNGVILLVFKNDRKMRIEVGYGLEGALPDVTAHRIIEDQIAPHFKKEDYRGGLFAGVDAIIAATKGEYKPTDEKSDEVPQWVATLFVIFLFFVFIPAIFYALIIRPILSFIWPDKFTPYLSSSTGSSSGWSSGSSWSSGISSFSGGGGSFGGGGSSGSW